MGKVLMVRQIGDPVLNQKCEEVNPVRLTLEDLEDIENLKETLIFTQAFGIAGPQIGVKKRIIVIKIEKENCSYLDCEDVPMTVMLNPSWKKSSDKTNIEYEGCLSVPSVRGKVERYKDIEVTYYNEKGEKIVKEVSGFTARDIQHECDHLDGIVFLDKVVGPNGFATKDMIKKHNLRDTK